MKLEVVSFTVLLVLGLICSFMGFLIWKKQKVSLIHDYHHKNVKEEDLGDYTRLFGIGMIVIGEGVLITGVINFVFTTQIGWFIFAVSFIIGMTILNKAQKKYNGSLF